MNPLLARVAAANATKDRFFGKPFDWGRSDCARLAAFQLQRLGHKPGLSRLGRYSSEFGGVRALKRLGHEDTAGWVDDIKTLMRVPPAYVLVGDIVGLPGGGLTALCIAMGAGQVLGFHGAAEHQSCRVVAVPPEVWAGAIVWKADPI